MEGQLCSLCAGLSETDCSLKIDSIISKFSNDELYKFYKETSSTSSCDTLDQQSCLEKLSGHFLEISFEDKMKYFFKGCENENGTNGPQTNNRITTTPPVSRLYSAVDCDLCDGISDNDCTDKLLTYILSLESNSRLDLEKDIFSGECKNIPDSYCLAYFDEILLSLKNSKLKTLLIKSCASGKFYQADHITQLIQSVKKSNAAFAAEKCTLCDSMGDADCLSTLTSKVEEMNDKTRLSFEKKVFGSDVCTSKTDKECLILLDLQYYSLSDDDRLIKLSDACSQDLFEQATTNTKHLATITSNSCSYCDTLSDDECLTSLTASLQSTSDDVRMAIELEIFEEDCTNLDDVLCLKYLDSVFESLSDTERLSALKNGCSAGLIQVSSSLSKIFKARPMSLSFISLSQFLFAGVAVAALVIYFRRRERNEYIVIPDNNNDIEFEI